MTSSDLSDGWVATNAYPRPWEPLTPLPIALLFRGRISLADASCQSDLDSDSPFSKSLLTDEQGPNNLPSDRRPTGLSFILAKWCYLPSIWRRYWDECYGGREAFNPTFTEGMNDWILSVTPVPDSMFGSPSIIGYIRQ